MSQLQWKELHAQHAIDLAVYRSAHEQDWNRRLHYVLIPLEVASFLWLVTTVLYLVSRCRVSRKTQHQIQTTPTCSSMSYLGTALAWTLGLLSCWVATHPVMGMVIFLLHVFMEKVCRVSIPRLGLVTSAIVGGTVWVLSWSLQIGVGHYWIEGKPPNLFNPDDKVSLLSACTSIVLAWEC